MTAILFTFIFCFLEVSQASFEEFADTTTVSRVVLGKVQTSRLPSERAEAWKGRANTIHENLVKNLNQKSYLDVAPEAFNIPVTGSPDQFQKVASRLKVDGIFSMDARLNDLRIVLRSGKTGRPLGTWSFPYKEPISEADLTRMIKDISNSIVGDFPYIGYVKKVSGGNVLINLGRKHQATPGTILQVFEFDDETPNFSSPKSVLGKIMITKVADNGAIARVSRTSSELHSFAKIEPYVKERQFVQDQSLRHFESFWLSAGPQFTLLDTTGTDEAMINARKYRVTLTPFYKFNAGYGPFWAHFVFGSTNQEKNSVTHNQIQANYDLYLWDLDANWKTYTGLGFSYTRTNTGGTLVSSTHYSPLIDQALFYRMGANTRFFLGAQLLLPIFSNDSLNGSGEPGKSYGFSGYGGLRVQISPDFAFEGVLTSKSTKWTYSSGTLQEIFFSSSFSVIYLL